MKKYLLDTNYFARFLIKDNPEQFSKILELITISGQNGDVLYGDNFSIFELCYVLTGQIYGLSRSEVSTKLIDMLHLGCFVFEDQKILLKTLEVYSAKNLDIVDCFLIAKSVEQDLIFTTFDLKANKEYQNQIKSL
jgi:predicted nucleic-acid-binding protein